MSEPVKFTSEEIQEVKSLQKDYLDVQNKLGLIVITRIRLEDQLNNLNNED